MADQPLIVFDSGIGGFSILSHLKDFDIPIIYFADQANFPYGEKPESWVSQRLVELVPIFAKYNPRGIVVACNTGTVAGIDLIRSQVACPVFGVEPVVKMLTNYTNPVIWGTKITVSSAKAVGLKKTHGDHVRYYTPTGLASAIEYDDSIAINKVLGLARIELGEPDAIGLSCTHYPLIAKQIGQVFPNAKLYDPSLAVATHIQKTLKLTKINSGHPRITYLTTGDVLRLKKMAKKYL